MDERMLIGDWNDLERHLSMGLKIISVEVGEGAEMIITAEIPEEVRMELENRTRKRKPGLGEIMAGMARRAEQDWW